MEQRDLVAGDGAGCAHIPDRCLVEPIFASENLMPIHEDEPAFVTNDPAEGGGGGMTRGEVRIENRTRNRGRLHPACAAERERGFDAPD